MKEYLNKKVMLLNGDLKGRTALTKEIIKDDRYTFKFAIIAELDDGNIIYITRPEHFRVIN